MEKIDKVRRGLECCIVRDPDDKHDCVECPYRDPTAYCVNRLNHDALEVINALAPVESSCGPDACDF